MNHDLEELAAAALRGTARARLPQLAPTPLGGVLARVNRPIPEATLLARAALAGLHAQAGQRPLPASVGVPVALPPDPNPVSEEVSGLLVHLTYQRVLLAELLREVAHSGKTLSAKDAVLFLLRLPLPYEDSSLLWPALGERARWLVQLHPERARYDPQQPGPAQQLRQLRQQLTEAHAANPEQTAAKIMARWPSLKADERRAALGAAASSLHPADLPLLALARTDKLADIRRRGHLLQGHLPGTVQDEVKAALKARATLSKSGKLKLLQPDPVAALGLPDLKDKNKQDTALSRVLGALPLPLTLEVLGVEMAELLSAVRELHPWGFWDDWLWAASGGVPVQVLAELNASDVLAGWPSARIRQQLWAALDSLARSPGDLKVLGVAHSLLSALSGPLLADTAPTPAQGLLGKLKRLVQPRATPASQLSTLVSLLLREMYAARQPYQFTNLVLALAPHLDPAHLPGLPDAPPLAPLPPISKTTPQEHQEAADKRREEVVAVHTDLLHILHLRRRLHGVLGELK